MSLAVSTGWNSSDHANDHELTLSIEGSGEVRGSTPTGSEVDGAIELDSLHRAMIELFDSWVRDKRLRLRHEFELFGALLWRSLFPPDVERLLERELHAARGVGARLRLQLLFREPAAELAGLPWEYTYRPSSQTRAGLFLGTSPDLVVSRYVPLGSARGSLAPESPSLRVLVAVSKPADMGTVLTSQPIEAIEALECAYPVEVSRLSEAKLDALIDSLAQDKPHVVHFLGHGRYLRDQRRGEIALLADDQTADWLDDERFAELLTQGQAPPRLVVLHLCEGGAIDYKADFAGLALQLVRREVQAVVAMQYPITNRTAVNFSTTFYQQLADGAPVDHATQAGRWRLGMAGRQDTEQLRDFGAPVLYMRARSGLLSPQAPNAVTRPGV